MCHRSRFILYDNEIGMTNMVINKRITVFYKKVTMLSIWVVFAKDLNMKNKRQGEVL